MSNDKDQIPRLDIVDVNSVVARGRWRVESLAIPGSIARIQSTIRSFKEKDAVKWDLSQILELDYIGAQLLWDNWNKSRPQELVVTVEQNKLFSRLECTGSLKLPETKPSNWCFFEKIRKFPHTAAEHFSGTVGLVGQLMIDLLRFAKAPHKGPWTEISANIYHAGAQALSITAIVGFLIGVVLSYLSAQQLHVFGGDAFLVNLLGMSVIRELGPLLAAILVAGPFGIGHDRPTGCYAGYRGTERHASDGNVSRVQTDHAESHCFVDCYAFTDHMDRHVGVAGRDAGRKFRNWFVYSLFSFRIA